MSSDNRQLDPALEILKKRGYTVGASSVKDGVMHVAIDDVPRTLDEIFQMVSDYVTLRCKSV